MRLTREAVKCREFPWVLDLLLEVLKRTLQEEDEEDEKDADYLSPAWPVRWRKSAMPRRSR